MAVVRWHWRRVASDVRLQLAQNSVDGNGIAAVRCGKDRPVDPAHLGPSNALRPTMAQAGQKPNRARSAP
jgi:hypothetical protein